MLRTLALTLLVLGLPTASRAEDRLTPAELRQVRDTVSRRYGDGALALRDLPVYTGINMVSAFQRPMVHVTPSRVWVDDVLEVSADEQLRHALTTWWGIRVLDAVEVKRLRLKKGVLLVDLRGKGAEDRRTLVALQEVTSPADVLPALERILTRVSPVEGRLDWSEAVREAIAERRVIVGMTAEQARWVVGEPKSVEDRGNGVEIWRPRQTDGVRLTWGQAELVLSGLPAAMLLRDGVVVEVAAALTE